MLNLYRHALAVRRQQPALRTTRLEWVDGPADILHWRRPHPGGDIEVMVSVASDPHPLPDGEVLASTGPMDGGTLPSDGAAWVLVSGRTAREGR